MRLSIIVIIAALAIGGIVAISGFITNQQIADITELSDPYTKLDKYKNEYLEFENQWIEHINQLIENQHEMLRKNNILQFNDDSEKLKEPFDNFLFQSIISFRLLRKFASLLYKKEVKSYKDFFQLIEELYGKESDEYSMFTNQDSDWTKILTDLRNGAEHLGDYYEGCSVIFKDNLISKGRIPHFKHDEKEYPIRFTIENLFENLLTYTEDTLGLLLSKKFKTQSGFRVIKAPDLPMAEKNGYNWIVYLNETLEKSLFDSIKKQKKEAK